jgi:hypothetical protein
MTTAYDAGLSTFNKTFESLLAEGEGKPWRAGGRATKANPNKEDANWWRANGPAMVWNYYTWREQNPNLDIWITPAGVPAIEVGIETTLPNNTPLKSFIDRVFQDKNTGQLLIVDLKTGKPPMSGLQLGVYRLALKEMFDVDIQYGAYWMGREGTLTSIYNLDQYSPDMVSRWIRNTFKAINLELYTPNVAQHCGWCSVSRHCYTQNPDIVQPSFNDDIESEESK